MSTFTISDPDLGDVEVRVISRDGIEAIRRRISNGEVKRRAAEYAEHPNRRLRRMVRTRLFQWSLLFDVVVDAGIRQRLGLHEDGILDSGDAPAFERLAITVEQSAR